MRTWLLCIVSLWASTWAHRRLPISRQTAAISSMSGRLRPSHNVLAASALQQLRVAREVRACVGRTQHPANGGGRRARHTKCPGSRGGQQHAAAAACMKKFPEFGELFYSGHRPAARAELYSGKAQQPESCLHGGLGYSCTAVGSRERCGGRRQRSRRLHKVIKQAPPTFFNCPRLWPHNISGKLGRRLLGSPLAERFT
jgi:hypothetical protein